MPTDYYLIERPNSGGPEITFALYRAVNNQHRDGGS
jgi:hypothetical protein